MPSMPIGVGSDHEPAGSSAVTKKLLLPPAVKLVVMTQKRPAW